MKYLKVKRGKASYVSTFAEIYDTIKAEFSDSKPGDKIILELVEMSVEYYEKLPEFVGW